MTQEKNNQSDFVVLAPVYNKPRYYNWNRTFGYNALFYLVITERNLGKTYGLLIKLLRRFVYKKQKTVILAKFKYEVDPKSKDNYQNEILTTINEIIDDKVDRVVDRIRNVKLKGRQIYINGKVAFIFYGISEAETAKKNTSLKTYDIIWHDECLRFDRYVPNEIDKLMTIYQTVDRRKNTTLLIMTGNAVSRYNPYIEDFDLLDEVKETGYTYISERDFLVHISNDKAFQEQESKSATAKLAGKSSRYIKMATEGQFIYDEDPFIVDTIEEFEQHIFMLVIGNKDICFSKIRNGYYLHTKRKMNRVYHARKMPTTYSVPLSKDNMDNLVKAFNNSLIYYENIEIKKNFEREYMGVIASANKR